MSELTPNPLPSEMTEKQHVIEDIIAKDRAIFDEWRADPNNAQRLDMPHEALRYLIIPGRILELVEDPNKVDVIALEQSEDKLNTIVVDHRNAPISNPDNLKKHFEELQKMKAMPNTVIKPTRPLDVDSFHVYLMDLGYKDKFSLNDFVTNEINLHRSGNERMHVDDYNDRDDGKGYKHQGVAKSFYRRLHNSTKDLGYRLITGNNDVDNVEFFTDKLGRIRLSEVRPQLKGELYPNPNRLETQNLFTIDFLYPDDREKFVDPTGKV